MTTLTDTKPKDAAGTAEPAPVTKKPELVFEDDDFVTVIARSWGDPQLCPPLKEASIDRVTFTGGVARNVRYDLAKKWVKLGIVSKDHIFANNASVEDFMKATGRNPLEPGNLATALQTISPEKLIAILGDEHAKAFAKAVQAQVSSRKATNDDDK
ncbi:MAG TPA: hypothetical protein VFA10_17805 [Ktedonobacteraceae bacterium]|nr:hypothetical protein [Ktedonobacteraceae bacterium]